MNKAKEIGNSIKNGWIQLEKKKRIWLVLMVSTTIILLGLLGYFTQRSQYTVLFTNLEEADAGAIVDDLESQGMKYRLEDNGTTILVDEKTVDNYRIDLAVNGLMPVNSTGFEIFDDMNMMTTDEDRQIMYQRALTGELERSINSLQQVEAAKVMLSLPEDSIFQNPAYRTESSASIVIQTKGSQQLSQQTIQGIASLLTGAVERLPIENVQIVDTNGNLLSGFLQSNGDSMMSADFSTNYQNIQRTYEQDLEQRILSLLAPAFGYNNLRVVVNSSMNFDVVEGETIEYSAPMTEEGEDNREGLVRSQTESFDGAREIVDGLMEGADPLAEDGDQESTASVDRTVNYELDQVTERYVRAPGVVEAVNASVIVNQNAGLPINYEQIDLIVSTALGITDGLLAGDVTVESLAFAQSEDLVITGGGSFIDEFFAFFKGISGIWLYMTAGLVLLLVTIVVLSNMKRRRREAEYMAEFMAIQEEDQKEQEVKELAPAEVIDKENEFIQQKKRVMSEKEDRVRDQARENPELAAELMKVWLKE